MNKYIDLDQIEFLKVDGNKEFNHGVDCCINRLQNAKPIEIVSLDKVRQARKEIQKYEADCLILEDRPICLECNENMFKSIYHILDKLIESEAE